MKLFLAGTEASFGDFLVQGSENGNHHQYHHSFDIDRFQNLLSLEPKIAAAGAK